MEFVIIYLINIIIASLKPLPGNSNIYFILAVNMLLFTHLRFSQPLVWWVIVEYVLHILGNIRTLLTLFNSFILTGCQPSWVWKLESGSLHCLHWHSHWRQKVSLPVECDTKDAFSCPGYDANHAPGRSGHQCHWMWTNPLNLYRALPLTLLWSERMELTIFSFICFFVYACWQLQFTELSETHFRNIGIKVSPRNSPPYHSSNYRFPTLSSIFQSLFMIVCPIIFRVCSPGDFTYFKYSFKMQTLEFVCVCDFPMTSLDKSTIL